MAGGAERLPEAYNQEPLLENQMEVGKWFYYHTSHVDLGCRDSS